MVFRWQIPQISAFSTLLRVGLNVVLYLSASCEGDGNDKGSFFRCNSRNPTTGSSKAILWSSSKGDRSHLALWHRFLPVGKRLIFSLSSSMRHQGGPSASAHYPPTDSSQVVSSPAPARWGRSRTWSYFPVLFLGSKSIRMLGYDVISLLFCGIYIICNSTV
jgi:hypothetical protein